MDQNVSRSCLQYCVASEQGTDFFVCLITIWQTLTAGSEAGINSLMQPLKGEENVMCSLQVWFLAEEDLRTATHAWGGLASLPALLVNDCTAATLCWDIQGLQILRKERRALGKDYRPDDFATKIQMQLYVLDRWCPYQTSYLCSLHPFFLLFSRHLLHVALYSEVHNGIQSITLFHNINWLTQWG